MTCEIRAIIPWNDHAYIVVEHEGAFYEPTCVAYYIAYGSIEFYQIIDARHGFVAHGPPLGMKCAVGWDGVRW